MFMPTVQFLRAMAVEKKCSICGCHYWGAMEAENVGTCGGCLQMAFPVPMRSAPVMGMQSGRKPQLVRTFFLRMDDGA